MRLSGQLSYFIKNNRGNIPSGNGSRYGMPMLPARRSVLVFILSMLLTCATSYAQQEVTIQLDDKPARVAPAASAPGGENEKRQPAPVEVKSPKELKKEIKALYSEAEKNRKKKRLLYAVQKYKEILRKDPLYKKAKDRLSKIYADTRIKIEDRVFSRSEDAYYAQSVIFYTNNDLTGALNEWSKYMAIDSQNEEVSDFYKTTKNQLTLEYNRKKQAELDSKIKKLLEDGIDYFSAQKYRDAADRFRTILNMSPGHVQAGYYLDQINTINAPKERVRVETKIVREPAQKIDEEKATEYYTQGLQEYAAGHLREAVELWRKCLKYNPNHAKAKSNIIKAQMILEGK